MDEKPNAVMDVTIVVTQRERFGMTELSFANLLENTPCDLPVIYVDSGSPKSVQKYLQRLAADGLIEWCRVDRFITPNEARALGLSRVKTKYAVFIDNDLVFQPGWLEHLVDCAERRDAAAVIPLTCEGWPPHSVIHQAGGQCLAVETDSAGRPASKIVDAMFHQGETVASAADLKEMETDHLEFHCVLLRCQSVIEAGGFDAKMKSTKEHVDLAICLRKLGFSIWLVPKSVVTYVFPCKAQPVSLDDLPFLLYRWSEEFGQQSWDRLIEKHGLQVTQDFIEGKLGFYSTRRKQAIIMALCNRWPILRNETAKYRLNRLLNRYERPLHRLWFAKTKRSNKNPTAVRVITKDGQESAHLHCEARIAHSTSATSESKNPGAAL